MNFHSHLFESPPEQYLYNYYWPLPNQTGAMCIYVTERRHSLDQWEKKMYYKMTPAECVENCRVKHKLVFI